MDYSQAKELYDMGTEIVMKLGQKHELLKHFPDHDAFWSYKDSLISIDWRPDYFVLQRFFRRIYYPSAGEHGIEVRNWIFCWGRETPSGLWVNKWERWGYGQKGQRPDIIPIDYIRALCLVSHLIHLPKPQGGYTPKFTYRGIAGTIERVGYE